MSMTVSKLLDVPHETHFAILVEDSVVSPGDARCHSSPDVECYTSTERVVRYRAFTARSEWEEEITRLKAQGDCFRAIRAMPAEGTKTAPGIVAPAQGASRNTGFSDSVVGLTNPVSQHATLGDVANPFPAG